MAKKKTLTDANAKEIEFFIITSGLSGWELRKQKGYAFKAFGTEVYTYAFMEKTVYIIDPATGLAILTKRNGKLENAPGYITEDLIIEFRKAKKRAKHRHFKAAFEHLLAAAKILDEEFPEEAKKREKAIMVDNIEPLESELPFS